MVYEEIFHAYELSLIIKKITRMNFTVFNFFEKSYSVTSSFIPRKMSLFKLSKAGDDERNAEYACKCKIFSDVSSSDDIE